MKATKVERVVPQEKSLAIVRVQFAVVKIPQNVKVTRDLIIIIDASIKCAE